MTDPGTAPSGPETASEAAPGPSGGDTPYERLRAAMSAGYSGPQAEWIADRLTGETPEELAADAQSIVGLFSATPTRVMATDPSQGRADTPVKRSETLAETLKRMTNSTGGNRRVVSG